MMTRPSVKDQVREVLEDLPADASFGDVTAVIDRLRLISKVQHGRREVDAGQGISHEEAKACMKKWHP
jgi:hypothetical protein